jgi:hypothetical protein
MKQISGLMVLIANIKSSIIHITHSATARLDLYTAAPPKTASLEEDSKWFYQELLDELQSVMQQFLCMYHALRHALG